MSGASAEPIETMQQSPTQQQLEQVCGPEGQQLTEFEIEEIKKEAAKAHERHEEKQRRRSEEYWREKRARRRNFERMVL